MNTFSPTPPDEVQKHLANSSLPFLTENEAEVARLMLQHRRLTELMGNALPPTLNLSRVRRVLDVGCGVGAWVYEMAWRHPDMQLVGIDKSAFFIDQALRHIFGGIPKITYLVQDMHHLEGEMFAPGSFDLIHMRFLVGDVTVQAFPSLLRSLAHLCRPGGFFVRVSIYFRWCCMLCRRRDERSHRGIRWALRRVWAAGCAMPGIALRRTRRMRLRSRPAPRATRCLRARHTSSATRCCLSCWKQRQQRRRSSKRFLRRCRRRYGTSHFAGCAF